MHHYSKSKTQILPSTGLQAIKLTVCLVQVMSGHVQPFKQEQPEWRLEVHFPDVSANLYGLLMRVTFFTIYMVN
jgi:FAD synthase